MGIRPPSRWNFSGFLRNSTISWSSDLAFSRPGDLVERGALLRLIVPLRRALDEAAEDAAVELVARPPHHQVDQAEDHERRQEQHDPDEAVGRWAGCGSIRTASPLSFRPGSCFASSWISFSTSGSIDSFGREIGDEPLDTRLLLVVARGLIDLLLAELAADLGALDRDAS